MSKVKGKNGFTLVEILIFVSLISLIYIAMAYIAVATLQSTKFNEAKVLATRYAEELRDWLKGEKEKDWNNFTKTGTFCFNTSPIPDCPGTIQSCAPAGNCGSNPDPLGVPPNKIFKRYVTLQNPAPGTRVDVFIRVEWSQGNNNYGIPLSTTFTLWE